MTLRTALTGAAANRAAILAPAAGDRRTGPADGRGGAGARVRLRRQIRELHQRLGITTIMVTHDQEEALTMADRIVVMNHGVIEQVGTPDNIHRRPASRFVADFVGTMNMLPGVVADTGRVRLGGLDLECEADATPGAAVTVRMPADPRFIFDDFYDRLRKRGFVIHPGKLTVADSFRIGCIGRLGTVEMTAALRAIRDTLADMGVADGAPAGEGNKE